MPAIGKFVLGHYWRDATPESRDRWLTYARRVAVTTWAAVVIYRTVTEGLAFERFARSPTTLWGKVPMTFVLADPVAASNEQFHLLDDFLAEHRASATEKPAHSAERRRIRALPQRMFNLVAR